MTGYPSAPPPPPPGGYPPPPPYRPVAPQGLPTGPPQAPPPGRNVAPRPRAGGSGMAASVIALVVIVGGVLATVLLATSDANKKVPIAGAPSGTARPSGLPSGRLPSGRLSSGRLPSTTGLPTSTSPSAGTSTGYTSAAALGGAYFTDLAAHLYFTSRGLWCVPSSFPLTVADVDAVTSAVSQGPLDPSAPSTSVSGAVSLDDGRSGTVTVVVQQQGDGTFCIVSQTDDL